MYRTVRIITIRASRCCGDIQPYQCRYSTVHWFQVWGSGLLEVLYENLVRLNQRSIYRSLIERRHGNDRKQRSVAIPRYWGTEFAG